MDMLVKGALDSAQDSLLERKPVYEILAADIARLGVPVFGLMSDDTMLLAATLDANGTGFHAARHENGAIAMAEGYAAATGGLGLALIGRGPAMVNGLHGAVYASRTGSKVLIMFGDSKALDTDPNPLGPDGKALDAASILRAAGLRTFEARSPAAAQAVLADAIAAAQQGQAVALLLPLDVQRASVQPRPPAELALRRPRAAAPAKARGAAITAATALLQRSQRPLFVCGIGAHRSGAREAIERLADKTGAVLATSLKAKDMFRGNPWNVGIIGSFSHSAGRQLIDQADCVLVFGASFNQRTTSGGEALPPGAPVIHVDLQRSHVGRWGPAELAVIGDARLVAEQLIEALPDRAPAEKPFHSEATRSRLAGFDITSDFQVQHTAHTLDPRALAHELDRLLPPERNLVYDSGNFLQVLPYLGVQGPDHLKNTSDFFSVGMGFGTALGFAKARPGAPTVLFIGDGGFAMTLTELDTAVREDIPLIIVVMNDCAYGAELHYLQLERMPAARALFPDVDYAPVAEAFGFRTATIRTLDDLRRAAPLLQSPDGPVLLDCKINASISGPFTAEMSAH